MADQVADNARGAAVLIGRKTLGVRRPQRAERVDLVRHSERGPWPRIPTWFQPRPSSARAWREREAETIMLQCLVTMLSALPRSSLHNIWAEMLEIS